MPIRGWVAFSSLFQIFAVAASPAVAQSSGQPASAHPASGHHAPGAQTGSVVAGSMKVDAAWTRATPGGARIAGGYLKVTNSGTAPDRLLSATADIAGRVEVHEMAIRDGVMTMRPLDAGLAIEAGETVELKPGSFHLMLMDLRQPVKEGDTVKVRLQFERAGQVDVTLAAAAIGAQVAPGGHAH